ncbi:MAG: putative 2-aminoethylphosphonate ABC transporter ATP-binding protein [Rhodospirillaceae bacterium]|nr:putative 2-aminoethylphosphonate ABC transporter ATP-binding protein [Rhodospirillaceae bacterium]MBL6930716.1 putative 2-aminoethylphosphonate ABC transporter ATP-binding protein [Rhodospirillales bacterium]
MSDTNEPYLQIRGVTKMFGDFTALKDVSLEIFEGEFVCFLGPSGCGKTTLLRAIAGLDIQTSGSVEQGGKDISNLPPSERDFGIVFQSYALFPNLSISRNVGYGLENRKAPKAEINARVSELLELVGMPEQGEKYPAQLSGGQQQRVALARALATKPGLLLLDEPLSALDAKVRVHLRHEIKQLQHKLGVTTIMVTHDQEEALTMADRIVVMNEGSIDQVGTPLEIYRRPTSPFVADFVGTMNFLKATVTTSDSIRIGDADIGLESALDDMATGSSVTVCIRPEDVIVRDIESETDNIIDTVVVDLEFLGSFYRAMLKLNDQKGSILLADFSINLVRDIGIEEGKSIQVCLPARRLRIFSDSEGEP